MSIEANGAVNDMASRTSINPQQVSRAEWFDNLIAALRTHELQLENDTANEEMKKVYDILMENDFTK